MLNYYSRNLSAERLQLCYDIAPPRIQQYLEAEINLILERIKPNDLVLELGCGYGRVLKKLENKTENLIGIDSSIDSLRYAREKYCKSTSCQFLDMNAAKLGFTSKKFDLVFCIQNGISVFKENPEILLTEALRVTRSGGRVLFSSYSYKFWEDRLSWFQIQAENGLIGEIDYQKTKNGVIVCKDGFKAKTYSEADFKSLTKNIGQEVNVYEVDNSSIFCEIVA